MIATEKCKICGEDSNFLFESIILSKYSVKYFKCNCCDFIQTEEPYWLSEAYTSPIALIDVGLLYRNITLSEKTATLLDRIDPKNGIYLDYGGGYGTLVRLMRDKGYNFYLYDLYSENLFAKYFELTDSLTKSRFTALTAFEVFEHLVHPINEIEEMFKLSDIIIFSTELQPSTNINKIEDWWYFVPQAGQHVSLYSMNSLLKIKKYFNCYLYSNNENIHVLSRKELANPFHSRNDDPISLKNKIINKFFRKSQRQSETSSRESLLMADFEYYKNIIINGRN